MGDSSAGPPTTPPRPGGMGSAAQVGTSRRQASLGLHEPAHVHLLPPNSSLDDRGPELMADNVSH